MSISFPGGVWPTMITPYNNDKLDFLTLETMIDWYLSKGASGLFAVCQSSEMFSLSLDEKVQLASSTVKFVAGRLPVIASGHTADNINDQIIESNRIIETGIDAFVFVTNRFARQEETDDQFYQNLEILLNNIPDHIPLGLYECPFPYKRLLSPELLSKIASTGRFYFLKDTSCSLDSLDKKLKVTRGTPLQIYNANAATLLSSLHNGIVGYSGIMANFHPELYVWLCNNWKAEPEMAKRIQYFLTVASVYENQLYPVNAKYYQQLQNIPIGLESRRKDYHQFVESKRLEIEHLNELTKIFLNEIESIR